jgi:hypothetical protein
MLTVNLLRKIGVLTEEYGRISFDGQRCHYIGLSCVFVKYLEHGVLGADGQCYKPEHGLQFLQSLQTHIATFFPQITTTLTGLPGF